MGDIKEQNSCIECQSLRKDFGITEKDVNTPKKPMTSTGKVILGIFGATFAGVTALTLPFVLPALRKVCLPYVPATTTQVNNVMKLLNGRKGLLVDLGSGDGRIVIEAARRGFLAEGVELNPWLVWFSRISALKHGVRGHTKFHTKDLWKYDLSGFDNVVIFGVEQMMPQLEQKLFKELPPEGCIIACRFPFPNWPIEQTQGQGIDSVWKYSRKGLGDMKL